MAGPDPAITRTPRRGCRRRCARDRRMRAEGWRRCKPARRDGSAAHSGSRPGGAPGRAACPGSPPGAHGPARARARIPAGPACRDAAGGRTGRATGASSTMRPAYITSTRSAVSATTPMLWVMMMIAMPNSSRRSIIRSRICAWMVTSSAVVGSSAISRRGRQASAIASITRWRWPPESWCG